MLKSIYRFVSGKYQNVFLDYPIEPKPRWGHGLKPHEKLNELIDSNRNQYQDLLKEFLKNKEHIHQIRSSDIEDYDLAPTWNNGFLPGLDVVALYGMIAHFKPEKYIEVGSGNSTKVANRAKVDSSLNTQIISIDPMPRAGIDTISNEIHRVPFEEMDYEMILSLKENDILFIDNSHRILPNSDSMVFYMEILPFLNKGVIVHIHDVYLPYDYPQFMCDRYYSEQYGLGMFLLANPKKYQTLMPNYFVSEDKELNEVIAPIWNHNNLKDVEKHGGSFWLRINE